MNKQTRSRFTAGILLMIVMTWLASPAQANLDGTCGVDQNTARNKYFSLTGGPTFPSSNAFAALKPDGSISVWGIDAWGAVGAPTDNGYVSIAGSIRAFAAMKADGSISSWGTMAYGDPMSGTPTDNGYVSIVSNRGSAFAAMKADGSISAWGTSVFGGTGAPTDSGYVSIHSSNRSFAAMKADGSITSWGEAVSGAPADSGYVSIYATGDSYVVMKADGSITGWGMGWDSTAAPTDSGYVSIYFQAGTWVAMKADGSITAWGKYASGAPADSGYVGVTGNMWALAALKADGSITAWGEPLEGGSGEPTDSGYVSIYATEQAFAALKADGSITAWGHSGYGGSGAPTDSSYVSIVSAETGFAALKADGSITAWPYNSYFSSAPPTDNGYVSIITNYNAYAAMKADGSITSWGNRDTLGAGAPTDSGYVSINGVNESCFKAMYPLMNPAANEAPVITSANTADFAENGTGTVLDITSTDDSDSEGAGLVYSLTGSGADDALFSIDAGTGVVTFNAAPDFETPADVGADNVYNAEIQVCDSAPLCITQAVVITVTDVSDTTIILNARAWLQGAFDGTNMIDTLRIMGYLPEQEPFSSLIPNPMSDHLGGETLAASLLALADLTAPVDWVLVELRDATNPEQVIAQRAAVLRRDGQVVDSQSGSADLTFNLPEADYQVAIRHRNHLGAMTLQPVSLSATPTLVDFGLASTLTWGSEARLIMGDDAVLRAGDANHDGKIITDGPNNDLNSLLLVVLSMPDNSGFNSNYIVEGYRNADVSLDGRSIFSGVGNDRNLVVGNVLLHADNQSMNVNYIIYEQLPTVP